MSQHFLLYWKPGTADMVNEHAGNQPLYHAASDQLPRVQPDDVVWMVIVYPPGELVVVGRLRVGECLDEEQATTLLGEDMGEADFHIIAREGTEAGLRHASLMDMAADLRFESRKKVRLTIRDGRADAQQLQSMRRLTPASVKLLEARWPS
jgi:hypothetical protein